MLSVSINPIVITLSGFYCGSTSLNASTFDSTQDATVSVPKCDHHRCTQWVRGGTGPGRVNIGTPRQISKHVLIKMQ